MWLTRPAGVSVGYELAQRCSVLVLEAEDDAPRHATARSVASYLPSYGPSVVRELTASSRPLFDALWGTWSSSPLLLQRPVLYVATTGQEEHLDRYLSQGIPPLNLRDAASRWPALRSEMLIGAALDEGAHDVDVQGLYDAYRRGLRAHGGLFVSGARVAGMTRHGGGWRVTTSGGTWSCGHVVNCAGAWADEVAECAGEPRIGLRALRRTAFLSPVMAPDGFAQWPFLEDVAETFYARPEGTALLASPADEAEEPPGEERPDELEIARALDRLRELTTLPLRSVTKMWAGMRTFAPDRVPVVGESRPGSGFWWCAGQGGYGIQLAPGLAQVTASSVLDRPSTQPLLASLAPTRFTGGS